MSYCVVGSSVPGIACQSCTIPRVDYNSFCLCPSFQLQSSFASCTDASASDVIIAQALQGLVAVCFGVQLLLLFLRVSTPFSWRAWTFLQGVTALFSITTFKDYTATALLRTAYLPKGFYWLPTLYPGIDLFRNVNVLLMSVLGLLGFLLTYLVLPDRYVEGFGQYIIKSWNYLFISVYLLVGNEAAIILSSHVRMASGIDYRSIGLIVSLTLVLLAGFGLVKTFILQGQEKGEALSMSDVPPLLNASWLISVFLSGMTVLFILANTLSFIPYACCAGLPLVCFTIHFAIKGFKLKLALLALEQILLFGWATVLSLQLVPLNIGMLVSIPLVILIFGAEAIYIAGCQQPIDNYIAPSDQLDDSKNQLTGDHAK